MNGIAGAFSDGLILPAALVAFCGWAVPRLWALILPEGVRPLLLNGFLSTLTMGVIGLAFFVGLYLWQGASIVALFDGGWSIGIGHFLRLIAISALLWAPIMVLSLSGLPRHWVHEKW